MENKILKDIDNVKSLAKYEEAYINSINDKENFWFNESKEVSWSKNPTRENILDISNIPFYKWFKDGEMNICYNCLDRHIEYGRGDSFAIIWESAYLNKSILYTYNKMFIEVNKLAKIFIDNGIKNGDTIIIYMPMIAEALFAMLSCARIGAIHCVVFGGFGVNELAERICDAKPKLIVTASAGIEPRKKISYYSLVNEAIIEAKENYQKEVKIILIQRDDVLKVEVEDYVSKKNTIIYQDEMEKIPDNINIPCVYVESNHPLYILYTSGTTGSPKGIVRDTGGICVGINYIMKDIMDIGLSDVVMSTSDIGWVVGHTFIVYGPLLRGATTIVFEGKPVGTPDCGKIWEIINKFSVKALFTSPSALRAIRREDNEYKILKSYDISSLKSIHTGGERCDTDTSLWLQTGVGGNILVNDHWGQTESGLPMCCNNIKIHRFPTIPGSACRPLPGYDIKILDEKTNQELTESKYLGKICIKLPMPPGFMLTLWGGDKVFTQKYITLDNKYYITGDCGYFDENGFIYIMARLDDIIKIAGHRLSTGRMEEILIKIKEVSDAAVVSVYDELKSELPFAFIICRSDIDIKNPEVVKSISENAKDQIVKQIGAISRLKGVLICDKLPKTRSGKIIKFLLKNIINKEELKIPSTIEDESVIKDIIQLLQIEKFI